MYPPINNLEPKIASLMLSLATIKVEIAPCLRKSKVEIASCLRKTERASHAVTDPYPKGNKEKDKTRCYSAPPQVVAFFGYLLSLVPSRAEALEWATVTNKRLVFYKRVLPPGTMLFSIPKDKMTLGLSDPANGMIQGEKIHII
jgi:hypothetical protein